MNFFLGGRGQREGYWGHILLKTTKMALISEYLAADTSPDASADPLAIINIGDLLLMHPVFIFNFGESYANGQHSGQKMTNPDGKSYELQLVNHCNPAKSLLCTGNGVIQTGNRIISSNFRPLINNIRHVLFVSRRTTISFTHERGDKHFLPTGGDKHFYIEGGHTFFH